ncbi:MAG: hypothetical protein EOP10_24295 [Proteobacteria bacterium]|nr:MAG: hypothetical protein EOP10_24295 [Pseudomonadota bacterium]
MKQLIAESINRFDSLLSQWKGAGQVEKIAPYAYRWSPSKLTHKPRKSTALTFQAVTHGNEVGGISALIECLKLMESGVVKPEIPLAFSLGNYQASLENRRFLEADLNRSFKAKDESTLEAKRALELTPLLKDTDYFLDFHQTIESSEKPFFIFPYAEAGMRFARAACGEVCVVTHWGKPFSLDGMCTDEFVNYSGGVGITVELGQKGFEAYQTSVGLAAALGAIRYVTETLAGKYQAATSTSPMYTWKTIELYEEGMDLHEGLYNFQKVKKGDVLGVHGSNPLVSRESGYLLFPKYQRDPGAPRPREIYRIAKEIGVNELGQPGVVGV